MAGSSKKSNKGDQGRTSKGQDELLPANLPLLIPRPEARKLLQDVIAGAKILLLKRTPSDLREDTPKAQALKGALKTWGAETIAAMTTCFGTTGAATIKSTTLSYTTLDRAKQRVRLRLKILQAALEHADHSQKVRGTMPRKSRSINTPRPKSSRKNTPNMSTLPDKLEHKYDFCLSFAGEDRKHAERLERLLTQEGARVFYDFAEEHNLWGKDLYAHLQDVYQNQSRYCVMFTSAHYVQKAWTNLERGAAQARSLTQPEYILPIKLDDTPVPGLLETKGLMDIRKKTLKEIAQAALKKLREAHPQLEHLLLFRQPKTKTPPKRARARAQGAASTLLMLGNHFYRALSYREAGSVITVSVWPRSDTEELCLRELAGNAYSSPIGFAYRRDGGQGRVQEVEYIEEGERKKVVVTLQRESSYTSSMTPWLRWRRATRAAAKVDNLRRTAPSK